MKELEIKISYQCNNNCVFCFNFNNKDKREFGNTIEKTREIIELFANNGGEKLIITGGEPLISKHFFELIHFAKQKGISFFEIQTNGRMLSYEEIVLELKKIGSVSFLVSLHFPNNKLYKKYSQSDGFDETVAGIKNLVKHNFAFTTNTVIMKPNLPYLKETVKLLKEVGVGRRAQYRFIDGKNIFGEYKEFVPRYSECVPVINDVISENPDIDIYLREFPVCVLGKDFIGKISPFLNPKRLNLNATGGIMTSGKIEGSQFIFPDKCKKCSQRETLCRGIRREYADIYGTDELKPIA